MQVIVFGRTYASPAGMVVRSALCAVVLLVGCGSQSRSTSGISSGAASSGSGSGASGGGTNESGSEAGVIGAGSGLCRQWVCGYGKSCSGTCLPCGESGEPCCNIDSDYVLAGEACDPNMPLTCGEDGLCSASDTGDAAPSGGQDARSPEDGSSDAVAAGDAGPLVAQCQALAMQFVANCYNEFFGPDGGLTPDTARVCIWTAYSHLCATGNTKLLIDSMNCVFRSTRALVPAAPDHAFR